jgi:hypothetical protein
MRSAGRAFPRAEHVSALGVLGAAAFVGRELAFEGGDLLLEAALEMDRQRKQ